MRLAWSAIAVAAALLATGCGSVVAEEPPHDPVRAPVPTLVDLDPDVGNEVSARVPMLARDSAERKARRGTLRVRNTACDGVSTGSGFALDAHTLVTNRGACSRARASWSLDVGRPRCAGRLRIGLASGQPRDRDRGHAVAPGAAAHWRRGRGRDRR